MRRVLAVITIVLATSLFPIVSAPPASADCSRTLTLKSANQVCELSGQNEVEEVATGDDSHVYQSTPSCRQNSVCSYDCTRQADDGEIHPGNIIAVTRDGEPYGSYCATDIDEDGTGAPAPVVTAGMVQRAFRSYAWPKSTLIVQPPNGRTLVNFKTNFLTDNAAPTTKQLTLLGTRVTVEATPSGYTWHHGDDTSETTSSPGARYPDLQITHEYLVATTVRPSVATTYTGRYRVGAGPWQQIPRTITVPGTPVDLEVVEAQPTLVDY